MGLLAGKSVLVTGGSRGIGAGIAREIASQGARVAITCSSSPQGAEEVLNSLTGEGHMSVQINVTDFDSVTKGIDDVVKAFGQVDGLVNNAGITKDQLLLRMSPEDFDSVVNTNLRGAFLCTKAILRPMMKAKKGSIIHITSVIGQMGNAGQSNYAASKAGMEAFSRNSFKLCGTWLYRHRHDQRFG